MHLSLWSPGLLPPHTVWPQCPILDTASGLVFAVLSYFWQEVYATIYVERNFRNAPSPKSLMVWAFPETPLAEFSALLQTP